MKLQHRILLNGEDIMKFWIRRVIEKMLRCFVFYAGKTKVGKYFLTQLLNVVMDQMRVVLHHDLTLKFSTPNTLCDWRVHTFSTKEPETLEWIDSIPVGAVLWDVGANIGLYSVYAAKKRKCNVWAFEPSVFNLELLARNLMLNDVVEKVCIVPLALSYELGFSGMRMTTTQLGGALSTFGQSFGWDGKEIKQVFEYTTVGMSMQDAVEKLNIPQPSYIKMDVDGLEHFILKGGSSVLAHVQGVLIEVNDDFHEQAAQCSLCLTQAGLSLVEKKHSDMIAGNTNGFQNSYNQIWQRC